MGEAAEGDGDATSFPIAGDLGGLRARAREFLARVAFDDVKEKNFILAMSEAANNVLDHSGTTGTLTMSYGPDRVVAEIHDEAGLLADPEAGRTPPPAGSRRGYGIWLMRQMCDAVEIVHSPAGSTVRLTMLQS